MTYEKHFTPYPNLKALFWPGAESLQTNWEQRHPLLTLVMGEGERCKHVASRTDVCAKYILGANEPWATRKSKELLKSSDYSNVSALLGEIRAYGELLFTWGKQAVMPQESGSDFLVAVDGQQVRFEVHTPQHTAKQKQGAEESYLTADGRIRSFVFFPFGVPERERDTVQAEAVSKLAEAKKAEHQFGADLGVLWLDLQDPGLWPLDFKRSHFLPISSFGEELTSGAFWNAFYGEKGLPVYDALSVNGFSSRLYEMEFPGRFVQGSRIDFVVADTRKHQIIFENHSHVRRRPDQLYRDFHRLYKFNLELSWLDWPNEAPPQTDEA
jgi:hypothetical protein